jgi:itaconate CoA-transferase
MYEKAYSKKLTTPQKAISKIPDSCKIAFGMAVSQPPALLKAVADRARAGKFERVDMYYMHAEEPANNTILDYDLMPIIKPHPGFIGKKERELVLMGERVGKKLVDYLPNSFSQMPAYMCSLDLDAFIVTVSPMDKYGFFSMGTNNDYGFAALRHCKRLIIEVNQNMPRVFGRSQIHIDQVAYIVENTIPLIEMKPRPPKPADKIIGEKIAKLIPDGATIQMGVGGVPDAVCSYLEERNDLGIHSELLSPGMVNLIKKGVVTGRKKNINVEAHVFTLAFGDKDMYDFMDDNPSIQSYPVDYVNSPSVIEKNDGVISVNGILEIDLYGQVNAEYMNGHQFGGPGGQNDFVRGARNSKGGKSILAFESTAKGGAISKIVPKLNSVATNLRIDTHYITTEYGVINLAGKTTSERAELLISVAHPDYRDELVQQAKKLHLL